MYSPLGQLAETINNMLKKGIIDPSAEEIAKEHFPGRLLWPGIISSTRKQLPGAKKILVKVNGLSVCLLSELYYDKYRKNPPKNESEASQCI